MFEKVLRKSKNIHLEKLKGVLIVPEYSAIWSAKKIWDMIEWIREEFVLDCKNTKKKDLKDKIFSKNNFQTRNTSRIISYIMHVYLLDGIINKAYEDFIRDYKKYIKNKKIKNNKKIPEKLSDEIKKIREFRHMVAAHTVYSSPKQGDNKSLKLTSLLPFSSSGFSSNGKISSFFVGGGMSVVVGNEVGHRKVPKISIHKSFPVIKKYFKYKELLFLDLLKGRKIIFIDK